MTQHPGRTKTLRCGGPAAQPGGRRVGPRRGHVVARRRQRGARAASPGGLLQAGPSVDLRGDHPPLRRQSTDRCDHRVRCAATHRATRPDRRGGVPDRTAGAGADHVERRLLRRHRRRDGVAAPLDEGGVRGRPRWPCRANSPSRRSSTRPRPRCSPWPSARSVTAWSRWGRCCRRPSRRIEELGARGSELTGIPTGFRDLDKMLAGLQPANLVVVAARPSMGKSALALNIAENVAQEGSPVAIFTLEMSREEVVARLLSSMASVDSNKLRTGQLGPELWQKVVREASRLYQMPLYVDDSPDLTVTAIRAKCRRLKRPAGPRPGGGRLHAVDAGSESHREPPAGDRRDQPFAQEPGSRVARAGDRGVAVEPGPGAEGEQAPPSRATFANRVPSSRTPTS